MRKSVSRRRRVRLVLLGLFVLVGVGAGATAVANAVPAAPSPGVVAGGFCTYAKGYFKTSTQAAQRINQYFTTGGVGSEIFHVGDASGYAYTWQTTGNQVSVGTGKNTVMVDSGVAALQQAVGTSGRPGAFSQNATNPTDMGTGGALAAQALALKINQGFSEEFVTPATGFSGLSLVNMDGVQLDHRLLTAAQVSALNGQATLQVRDGADAALALGVLPYGLSFSQLTDLIELLNGSFDSCGQASTFAQAHLYQPYVTSNRFTGKRPSTVSDFASKPTYNTFSGTVTAAANQGCAASDYTGFTPGNVALIERGTCTFYAKVSAANNAGASAAIIYNNTQGGFCPAPPGSTRCEALVGMGAPLGTATLPIPAAFVQRSTGLLLLNGTAPVTVFVQQ
jgi:hypothetical protein